MTVLYCFWVYLKGGWYTLIKSDGIEGSQLIISRTDIGL